MADTLESIYLNTSLGATELDDGEHTILTTNSTTRYVIKDMYVKDTSALTGTHLELNGFNVGGVTENATGSLIIPPNSTLKIKTTDYPYAFYKNTTWAQNGQSLYYKETYEDSAGNESSTTFEAYHTGLSDYPDMIDVTRITRTSNNSEYLYYTTNDDNSVQKYYSINNSSGAKSQRAYINYSPFMIVGNTIYSFTNSSALYYSDQTQGVSWTGTAYNSTNIPDLANYAYPTTRGNSYSPHATSSYPRGQGAHGFIWYCPSSGYTQDLYAVNVANGAFHRFSITGQTWTMSSNKGNFVPSVDWANDTLYIYFHVNNQNQLIQAKYDNWSSIVAMDNANNPNVHTAAATISNAHTQSAGAMNTTNTMSKSIMGYDASGGFTYMNTGQNLVSVDKDFNVLSTTTTLETDGQSITSPNYAFVRKQSKLTNSQASALSLTAPTFGMQILGIKSEA